MKLFFSFLIVVFVGVLPAFAYAALRDVVINEVAWMGTQASASDEWIELFNNAAAAIALDGWKVQARDGAPSITLSGTIPAGGFYLIERTSSSTVRDVAGDYVGSFGKNGSIENGGEDLELFDASGVVADSVLFSSGWPAGSANPDYVSMERKDPQQDGSLVSNWASNNGAVINGHDAAGNLIHGTPKAQNSVFLASATETASGGSGGAGVAGGSVPAGDTSLLPHSQSGVPLPPQPNFSVNAGEDRIVLAGSAVEFVARSSVKNDAAQQFRFAWNFGDGTAAEGRAVNHTYLFPGVYAANVSMASDELSVSDFSKITVAPPMIVFSEIQPGGNGFIELYNAGKTKIDIGGLMIKNGASTFTLPSHTYLDASGVLALANATTKLAGASRQNNFSLHTANGVQVDSAAISGDVAVKESFVRSGSTFIKTAEATPGTYIPAVRLAQSDAVVAQKQNDAAVGVAHQAGGAASAVPQQNQNSEKQKSAASEIAAAPGGAASDTNVTASAAAVFSSFGGAAALGTTILIGIAASAGFFLLRRFF